MTVVTSGTRIDPRVRFATDDEIERWDDLIEQNPDGGIMVQAKAMAAIKRYDRLEPRFLVVEGEQTVYALAHEGTVWLGRYWYIPLGPTCADLGGMVEAMREFGMRQKGLLAIKIEPHILRTPELIDEIVGLGLERSRDMQLLTHTVVLDLSAGDELIMQFQKKLRSSIRGAENKGYRVERIEAHDATEADFVRFYELLKTINGGKGVAAMREYEYYRLFWGEFAASRNGRFYFGYDGDGEAQAAIFVTLAGRTAVYKDGGSRPTRSIAGGAALLLWRAMQDAAADGKAAFDLCGTPKPEDMDDETHWYHGVGQFKRKFGPVVSYLPSFDLVLQPTRHRLWERVVRRVEWRIKQGTDALR